MDSSPYHHWVGLAGEGADMGSWLGTQKEGWVIGRGHKCHAGQVVPTGSGHMALKYKGQFVEAQFYGADMGQRVVMRVDMDKHECSFQVSSHGEYFLGE